MTAFFPIFNIVDNFFPQSQGMERTSPLWVQAFMWISVLSRMNTVELLQRRVAPHVSFSTYLLIMDEG